jgi:hypothetical protein
MPVAWLEGISTYTFLFNKRFKHKPSDQDGEYENII